MDQDGANIIIPVLYKIVPERINALPEVTVVIRHIVLLRLEPRSCSYKVCRLTAEDIYFRFKWIWLDSNPH